MTMDHYRASGGLQGAAVATTAEAVYAELAPGQQELARQLFLRLTHIGTDTADTRRPVTRDELARDLESREGGGGPQLRQLRTSDTTPSCDYRRLSRQALTIR
jgi:hypothetical protein